MIANVNLVQIPTVMEFLMASSSVWESTQEVIGSNPFLVQRFSFVTPFIWPPFGDDELWARSSVWESALPAAERPRVQISTCPIFHSDGCLCGMFSISFLFDVFFQINYWNRRCNRFNIEDGVEPFGISRFDEHVS